MRDGKQTIAAHYNDRDLIPAGGEKKHWRTLPTRIRTSILSRSQRKKVARTHQKGLGS
jgi:hypothetical protein